MDKLLGLNGLGKLEVLTGISSHLPLNSTEVRNSSINSPAKENGFMPFMWKECIRCGLQKQLRQSSIFIIS